MRYGSLVLPLAARDCRISFNTLTTSFKMPALDEAISLGVIFEESVRRHGNLPALEFEGRRWTYTELNQEVNRVAHLLKAQGVKQGEGVALFMENRAEFVMSLLAPCQDWCPCGTHQQ